MKKVLFVFKTPLLKCPRARRLIITMSRHQNCYFLCPPDLDEPHDKQRFGYIFRSPQSPFLRLVTRTATRLGWCYLASRLESARFTFPDVEDGVFDYIFVHDLYLLPYFYSFIKTKVIFDAREYYPLEFSDNKYWSNTVGKLAKYMCLKYIPHVYKCVTVSPSIVKLYEDLLGKKIELFPSFPREDLYIYPKDYSLSFPFKFIYHGNAFRNRGLEKMIELMEELGGDYQLDMMLVASAGNKYFNELKSRVENIDNVSIIPPVHPDKIIEACSKYDMGLYLMEANESQNKYCLPNKYFEFLYAGLPVVTSFSEDMRFYTKKFGFGLGFREESIQEIAVKIRNISERDMNNFRMAIKENVVDWNVTSNIRNNFPELINNSGV